MEKNKEGQESKQQAIEKEENNFCTSNARKKLDTAISNSDIESTTEILNTVKGVGSTTIRDLLVSPDESIKTTLHAAVTARNSVIVKKLLCSLKDYKETLTALLLFPDRLEETALHYAAKVRSIEDDIPQELLSFAQQAGGYTLTKLLLSPNVLRQTALHYAAEMKSNNDDMPQKLLDFAKQAEGNTLTKLLLSLDHLDETALDKAVTVGNEVIAKTLLDNARAIENHQYTFKKLLLSSDNFGETALDKAVTIGNEVIAKMLLDNARAIEDHQYTFKKLLLSSDSLRETALHKAVTVENEVIAKMLLDNARAIEDHQYTFKKLLLSSDNFGENALHRAVKIGNSVIVNKLFCSVEDDKNTLTALLLSHNQVNRTAVDYAAIMGSVGILKEILLTAEKIKDGNVVLTKLILSTDRFGDTALDNAISRENTNIAKILLVTARYLGEDTFKMLIECSNILIQDSAVAHVVERGNFNKFISLLKDARKNKYFETHTLETLLTVEEGKLLYLTSVPGEDSTHKGLDDVIDEYGSDNPASKENENTDTKSDGWLLKWLKDALQLSNIFKGKKADVIENKTAHLEKEQKYFNHTNDTLSTSNVDIQLENVSVGYNTSYTAVNSSSALLIGNGTNPSTSNVDIQLESVSVGYNTSYIAVNSSGTPLIGNGTNNISAQGMGLNITTVNAAMLIAALQQIVHVLKELSQSVSLDNNNTLLKQKHKMKVQKLDLNIFLGNNYTSPQQEHEMKVKELALDVWDALQMNADLFGDDMPEEELPELRYTNSSGADLQGDIKENEH